MEPKKIKKIFLYTRFERFWHWLQALLIITLIVTGFEIHGSYTFLGFDLAVRVHNFIGISWLILFVFIIFWVATTGEWRQYVPTTKKLIDVIVYYSYGIFQGRPHPVQKSPGAKHNPLQRLTYLGLSATLLPVQMVTGFLFYTYNDWATPGGMPVLGILAFIHTLVAFLILGFLVVHLYMTTTGHSIFSHIWAMISGWEEIFETTKIEDWETAQKKE